MSNRQVIAWGFHPVREFALNAPELLEKVIYLPSFGKKKREKGLLDLLRRKRVEAVAVERLIDFGIPQGVVHQGIGAFVRESWHLSEGEFLSNLTDALDGLNAAHIGPIVVCDGITDPQNFGSVIRGAVAFGIRYIVCKSKGGAPVTGTVIKASSGAIAQVKIVVCGNIRRFLMELKAVGWRLIGLMPDREDCPVWGEDLSRFDIAFILGGEHKGVRRQLASLCDALVSIPMEGRLDSLNVAQANSVVLYEALRQRLLSMFVPKP